jgi:hypothetical protein
VSKPKSALPPVPPDALLLSVRETAALPGRSENAVWTMLRTGQLTRVRAEGSTKIARTEIERLIREWQTKAAIDRMREAESP